MCAIINRNKRSNLWGGKQMNLYDIQSCHFDTEEDCENFLMKIRWSSGFCCPRCDFDNAYTVRTRRLLECSDCRMQVSLTAGTIMHKSKLPLLTWFRAIQLLIHDQKEYSASSLAEILGINYRSARLLLQKVYFALNKQSVWESRLQERSRMERSHKESIESEIDNLEESDLDGIIPADQVPHNVGVQTDARTARILQRINRKYSAAVRNNKVHAQLPTKYKQFLENDNAAEGTYSALFAFRNWLKAFITAALYPVFLKCYQCPS